MHPQLPHQTSSRPSFGAPTLARSHLIASTLHFHHPKHRMQPNAMSNSDADNTPDNIQPNATPPPEAPSEHDAPSQSPAQRFPTGLWDMDLIAGDSFTEIVRDRWILAYYQLGEDAKELGIPASAIPPLPLNPTKEELRRARDHLNGMIQSFLSSGL